MKHLLFISLVFTAQLSAPLIRAGDLDEDSKKWVAFEVIGQRPTEDLLARAAPDESESYDRAVWRRQVAESVEGTKAVHRAYHFVLQRSADPGGLAFHREELAAGRLTYWTLVDKMLRGPEHRAQFAPKVEEPPAPIILRGNFIRNEARESTHYYASRALSDKWRAAVTRREIDEGYNVISLMPWYECDYRGAAFPVNFQPGDESFWLTDIRALINQGLTPIIWMMTDDGMPFIDRASVQDVIAHWEPFIARVVEPLQLRYLILGLEALEYWTPEQIRQLADYLRQRCPWADIGFHTLAGDERLLGEDFFDTIYYQSTDAERISPEAHSAAIRRVIERYGKPVVDAEYTLSGESPEGKALGDSALEVGAIGAINGCTPAKEDAR
jgi:hypothetical protein